MSSGRQDDPEYEKLLRDYLEICNQSIEGLGTSAVRDILKAALDGGDGQQIDFLLRDDRPKAGLSVHVGSQGLSEAASQQGTIDTQPERAGAWVFNYSYLKAVVDDGDLYVKEPERLDWSWLYMLIKSNQS
jgi:hypothetical protein